MVPGPSAIGAPGGELLQAEAGDDLGAGDGRLVIYLSRVTDARCVGIEISPFHFLVAKTRQLLARTGDVSIRLGDLYKADLSRADVIYVYGTPFTLRGRFTEKLLRDGKKGARVISYAYAIEGLDLVETSQPDRGSSAIHVHRL